MRLPSTAILLTSGYSHVLAEDDSHGFAIFEKPYSAEQLARTLEQVMKESAMGEAISRKLSVK